MKIIANLRTDVDTLKSAITEKHIEVQELRAENMALKEIAEHRAIDISRLRNELNHLSENERRLNEEKVRHEGEIQNLKEERRKLLDDTDLLTNNYDTLISKNNELEKLYREVEFEKQQAEKQNI